MGSSDVADNWQLQLEELVALQSIYGDDFRVLQAPILHEPPPSVGDTAQSSRGQLELSRRRMWIWKGYWPLGPGLLRDFAQGTCQPSACTGAPALPGFAHNESGAAGSTSVPFFTCEATVHVDIPAAGIQLMVGPNSGQGKVQQGGEGHGKQPQVPNGLQQQQQGAGGQERKQQGSGGHQEQALRPPQQHSPQQHQHQLHQEQEPEPHQHAQQHQQGQLQQQSTHQPSSVHGPRLQEGQRQQRRRHRRRQHQMARGHIQPQLPPQQQQQQQQQHLHTTHQTRQLPEHPPPTALEPIPLLPPPCTPPAAPPSPHLVPSTPSQSSVEGSFPAGPPLHHLPLGDPLVPAYHVPQPNRPQAHVSAIWLDPKLGAQLADVLQQKWQPGMPALYEWLDCVQSSALLHLGLQSSSPSEPLPLRLQPRSSPAVVEGDGCGRGWGGENLDDVCRSIQCYAASRARMLFQTSTCLCNICFEETLGAKCVLLDCNHAFCVNCTSTYFKSQLQSGQVEGMRCPDPSCKEPVPPYLLRAMFTPEEYAQWERLLLQRTLDKMDDVVFCPRCEAISLEDKDHCAECPSCLYAFCGVCLGSWHPGVACLSPEERLVSLQRRGVGGKGLKSAERQRMDMDFMNQIKSLQLIKSTTKSCPGCRADIERSEGCNKMKCTYCNTAFCYRCGQEVVGYEHFSAETCPIFDRTEVERWNAMYQLQGAHPGWLRQAPRRANNIQFVPCVVCGQVNVRENGNNLIRCYACRQFYCCLCREWLRSKPGLHFGPSKCKQHSA